MNPMREIRLSKVTVNIGAGESGPKLEKSVKLVEKIAKKKPLVTKTQKRTTFGVAKNRPIGAKATLRGADARKLLEMVFKAADNKINSSQFDRDGNFSIGVKEYIDLPGVKYEPDIGILGMDVCVTLERPGFRVKRRMIRPAKIGKKHKITPEEAKEWVRKEFNVEVINNQ